MKFNHKTAADQYEYAQAAIENVANKSVAHLSNKNISHKAVKVAGRILLSTSLVASLMALSACASLPSPPDALAAIKASFAERGIAKLDRLDQTEIQRICSEANASGKELDKPTRERIEKSVLASIKYPADGKFIGDWKEGEKIAQNGRGLQFSDVAGVANGANCYACHQISPSEISYGNQGPSLLKYGSMRGVKDPLAAESAEMVKYTWGRIYNTHAFNACSNMPRFGDAGILTQEQMGHVMALLSAFIACLRRTAALARTSGRGALARYAVAWCVVGSLRGRGIVVCLHSMGAA